MAEQVGVAALVVALSLGLQGCSIPRHDVGNWETKTSYLSTYKYVPPGANASSASLLNSCGATGEPTTSVPCSGHGACQEWFSSVVGGRPVARLSFCKCDTFWADPECSTPRKSQVVAYTCSVVLGVFGADQFYLGLQVLGGIKLLVCTGAAIWFYLQPSDSMGPFLSLIRLVLLAAAVLWYCFDVVRIGSSQAYTSDSFKLAADLSHSAFLLSLLFFMGLVGFSIGVYSIGQARSYKTREMLILIGEGNDAEALQSVGPGMYGSKGRFTGYGTTLGASRVA